VALVDHIHPNDVGFFTEVATRIREVAQHYSLPLRRVRHMANPNFATSPQGRCHADGTIELTIRERERGKWSEGTVSPERIWQVAAHELAHLRHMNHGKDFQEFESEMLAALTNRRQDTAAAKRDKVLDRLVKMQALRDSEAQIGNRGGETARIERVGGLQRLAEARAERQDRDLLAFAHDAALADLEQLGRGGQIDPGAVATRIAHRDRP
jgi:hypothetical protein